MGYRPICLLPIWGKLFDKVIVRRLVGFLENKNLLCSEQYSFRKGLSTVDALLKIKEVVIENMTNDILLA